MTEILWLHRYRLIDQLNVSFLLMERPFLSRFDIGACTRKDDVEESCDIPPIWKTKIKQGLTRAERVWPLDTSNIEAIELKRKFYALLGSQHSIIHKNDIFNFWNDFERISKSDGDFSEYFNVVLNKLSGVVGISMNIENTVDKLEEDRADPSKLDDVTVSLLAIRQMEGFPNEETHYEYYSAMNTFLEYLKKTNAGPGVTLKTDEDKLKRGYFVQEYVELYRLLLFQWEYNKLARDFISPIQREITRKILRVTRFVQENKGKRPIKGSPSDLEFIEDAKNLKNNWNEENSAGISEYTKSLIYYVSLMKYPDDTTLWWEQAQKNLKITSWGMYGVPKENLYFDKNTYSCEQWYKSQWSGILRQMDYYKDFLEL